MLMFPLGIIIVIGGDDWNFLLLQKPIQNLILVKLPFTSVTHNKDFRFISIIKGCKTINS